jgi:hypothetical protein
MGTVIAHIGRCMEWGQGNPSAVYDPELFRARDPAEAGDCTGSRDHRGGQCFKASASDYRPGKRTPDASTWRVLAELTGVSFQGDVRYKRRALVSIVVLACRHRTSHAPDPHFANRMGDSEA